MKKNYLSPNLKEYGSMVSVTAMVGNAGQNDYVFFASEQVPIDEYGGSNDAEPCSVTHEDICEL